MLDRCRALVIGPGLGRAEWTRTQVRRLVAESPVPVVADADALFALGDADSARQVVTAGTRPVVLTPHDGEYRTMAGAAPGPDRVAAARALAAAHRGGGAVEGLADRGGLARPRPGPRGAAGRRRVPRLATAGTGDVLCGIIGALVARGAPAPLAAALAAHVHGRAAALGPAEGLVAADLPDLVAAWLSRRSPGSCGARSAGG